jgi:hypothetical protein
MKPTLVLAVLLVASCVQNDVDAPQELTIGDEHYFRCNVQPVISTTCAFMDCHGNDERPFRTYAEQKFRLGIDWIDYELPITEEELAANLTMVRGFVAQEPGEPDLLSEKPLDTRAGGLFHRGKDLYWADDVFLSADEIGYQVLREFIEGAEDDAACVPRQDIGL